MGTFAQIVEKKQRGYRIFNTTLLMPVIITISLLLKCCIFNTTTKKLKKQMLQKLKKVQMHDKDNFS